MSPEKIFEEAMKLVEKKKNSEAISKFEECLAIKPNFTLAQTKLGMCYFEIGNLKKAEQHLLTSIKIDPNCYEAHLYLGRTYKAQNNLDKAIISLKKASKLLPITTADSEILLSE